MLPTIDALRSAIKDRRLSTLADQAGINRQTLYNFSCGATKTLDAENYRKLVNFLQGEENAEKN